MTGPASGGPERGTGAPSRTTGTQGAVGAVLFVLALGLALRFIIAQRLPGSGFGVDLQAFQYWASDLATNGPWGFYTRPFFHDYTPGYLYVLWLVGIVGKVIGGAGGIGDLIKIPPALADLAIGWLVYSMVLELGGRRRVALIAAFVAVMNPISWFDSVVWGQVDSFGTVFLLLGLRDLWRDRPERSAVWTVIAAIIKPQLGILIPLVAVVTIRRALWPAGGEGENVERTGHPIRILTTGLAGFLTAVVVAAPFGLTPIGLIQQVAVAGGGYPYLTVNAYNIWAVVPGDTGISLATAGQWVCDAVGSVDQCGAGVAVFGVVPAIAIGIALLLGAIVTVLWLVARRPDRLALIVGLAVLALAFFVLPTRVHERYGYPFFAIAVILAAVSWRWRVAYLLLSAATFANMYVVLTTLYTDNPQISDWLQIGSFIRDERAVIAIAVVNTLGFVWVFFQLRARSLATLEEEFETDGESDWDEEDEPTHAPWAPGLDRPAGDAGYAPGGFAPGTRASTPGAAAVTMPTWTVRASMAELGVVDWIRDRWSDRPARPDRSASLVGERGGRFDRLDVWVLAVLVVASLTLRTFRLEEPYQMHFDEVYHARTATEFLQDWRYGESHDIYEWTHPHLAKYVMALGIMAWGQDDVSATSDLGVPAVASAIEPRRDDPTAPGGRSGERLHVATGTELRTYDLRTRALISTIPEPGISAVAYDDTGTELILGFDDGRIETVAAGSIGLPEVSSSGVDQASLGKVTAKVDRIDVDSDGTTLAVAEQDHVDILDRATGAEVAGLDLPGLADLADGGTGSEVVATIADITNPGAEAVVLSDLLGGTVADYQRKLTASAPTINLGVPGTGDTRTSVETAISDGKLPGIQIQDIQRLAVATKEGVTFLDKSNGAIVDSVTLAGGAHGLGLVTGLDDPKLYVTSGTVAKPEYHVIAISGDAAATGPTDLGSHPLPGLGSSVVYDEASQMVHILGRVQGGSASGPWTVYVIEPHGNAVYADAKLPAGFTPSTWVADLEPQYPTDDRQQILVMDGAGAMAAIPVGSHAFAWRLPGVIAGTLMLVCLYLLTRILFRRRLVAGLVGLFVLIDGMMFVQSRIGMNDVYVGLFIVAAYALFAAVYTGWWRGRAAFWLAFPVIGLLLGLALASKWVALYAIGGVALLMLVRSALGRVVAILALIGITSVLGYMGITVPAGAASGTGNVLFLLLMVALTLVAVVAAILHPIAWTDEEMRFALGAPIALGVVVFFGALALGKLDHAIALGPISLTPLLASVALALSSLLVYFGFWVGGRVGFGPLAGRPAPGDPASLLEPPAPAPDGWLRMGWLAGIPVVWAGISLLVIPLVVYVISYLPWAAIENHQIIAGFPPGHTGQTLLDLTGQMYGYHNGLVAAHPADSPWWAWLFDLKPVWFYQGSFAGGTSGAIYDAGNLVLWWMGVPAMLFVSVMAFRRRSPALALIAVGFACQWISWARIDRAAFQYHYYTSLPFVLMALAYFMAELWHGASRYTWQLARLAGAIAIVLPAALWLFSRPLCAAVDVEAVNKGSAACPAVIPDFVLTAQTAALAVVIGIGLFFIVRTLLAMTSDDRDVRGTPGSYRSLAIIGAVVGIAILVASRIPDSAILSLHRIPVEPIVLVAALPLGYLALSVFGARDPRRFVTGFVTAAIAWFVILYPNISALPLPSQLVNAYQGILPTYLYAFQFPVSQIDRNTPTPLFTPMLGIITLAVIVTCAVVGYSAWVWRLSAAEANDPSDEPDPFARTGSA